MTVLVYSNLPCTITALYIVLSSYIIILAHVEYQTNEKIIFLPRGEVLLSLLLFPMCLLFSVMIAILITVF